MTNSKKQFWNIGTKLIVCFCLLFFIIMTSIKFMELKGIPFTPFGGSQKQLKTEAFKGLNLIADMKKERLLHWIDERRIDTHFISENAFTSSAVVRLRNTIDKLVLEGKTNNTLWTLVREKKAHKTLIKYLREIISLHEIYDRIRIADAENGTVIVSTEEKELGSNISNHPCFIKTLQSRHYYVNDIEIDKQDLEPDFDTGHVIKNPKGKAIAVLITEENINEALRPMLHTGEMLGERGEALLVNKEVKILTSLKHPLSDGTQATPLTYRIKAESAVLAARGEEGIIETEDYRGEPVLAAYRYIPVTPEFGWGLIVKRDKEELFAPLQQNTVYSFLIGLIGIFAFGGFTVLLSKNLTRPIRSLSRTADKIAKGDLDARAPVTTSDEVGTLTATFNSMVQRLENWHKELEKQVKKRTSELEAVNEMLRQENVARMQAEGEVRILNLELEQRVIERTAELEAANKDLKDFAYVTSHDLKAPLRGISQLSGWLLTDHADALNQDARELLGMLVGRVKRMENLINGILQYSRVGRIKEKKEQINLDPLLKDLINIIAIPDHIHVIIDEDFPVIFAGKTRIEQLFQNLLSNAIKFMDKPSGKIKIGWAEENSHYKFSVADNGPGIEKKYHEKIFQIFQTLESRDERESTGIGLSIVKKIIDLYGGKIWVESEMDTGCTFFFTLPNPAQPEPNML